MNVSDHMTRFWGDLSPGRIPLSQASLSLNGNPRVVQENRMLVRAYLGQECLDTVDQVLDENRLYDDMAGPGCYLRDVPCAMCFYQGYGLHRV